MLGPPSISLCMIVREAADMLVFSLGDAMRFVDEAIIVHTATEKEDPETRKAIKTTCPWAKIFEFSAETHPESFFVDKAETWSFPFPGPFTGKRVLGDFAAARNFGWSKATSEYVLWIDADDVLASQNVRAVVMDMKSRNKSAAYLRYEYEADERGNVLQALLRERILHKRGEAPWQFPVHEICTFDGQAAEYPSPIVQHRRRQYAQKPIIEQRNLKILMRLHESGQTYDPRMVFYLAEELRYPFPKDAISYYAQYCSVSTWSHERALAHVHCAEIHEDAQDWDRAQSEFALAAADDPENPDAYFGLGRCAYERKDWKRVIALTTRGLEANPSSESRVLGSSPFTRAWRPYLYLARAYVMLGDMKKAAVTARLGLQVNPTSDELCRINEMLDQHGPDGMGILAPKPDSTERPASVEVRFDSAAPLTSPPINVPHHVLVAMSVELWKRARQECPDNAAMLLRVLPKEIREDPQLMTARGFTRGPKRPEVNTLKTTRDTREDTPFQIVFLPDAEQPRP